MKKVVTILMASILVLTLAGCGKQANVKGTLPELMDKVYEGIAEEQLPMMLQNTEITSDNIEYYLGTSDISYKEALASESAVGSIAHSVVLIRAKSMDDVEEMKTKIKDSVNPNKWICVGVENVVVESKGDLIILIMSDDLGETIKKNFDNLK